MAIITGTIYPDILLGTLDPDLIEGLGGDDTLSGLEGSDILDGGLGADTLIGGQGDDTYVVDNASDIVTELIGEGSDLVKSSVTYRLTANVEDLTLTGVTAINGTGNALNNTLTGNSAANILNGGTGNDTLLGGGGNATYFVAQAGDVVTELAGAGIDTVKSSITWTLGDNVEKLTLTGVTAINGTGNTLNNTLTGNSAGNILNGGTGNYILLGGGGNDIYIVAQAGDVVTELAGAGIDTVKPSITWTLGDNVEKLTLTGSWSAAPRPFRYPNAVTESHRMFALRIGPKPVLPANSRLPNKANLTHAVSSSLNFHN